MSFVPRETNWAAHSGPSAKNGIPLTHDGTAERSVSDGRPDQLTALRPSHRTAMDESRRGGEESPTLEIAVEIPEAFGVSVVIVTTDDSLRVALSRLLPRDGVVFADSAERVLNRAAPDNCALLIVEQTLDRSSFERLKSHLKASAPALINVMVGKSEVGSSMVALLSAGCIDRFMVKPLKLGPTRSALRSALQQFHSLQSCIKVERAESDVRAVTLESSVTDVKAVQAIDTHPKEARATTLEEAPDAHAVVRANRKAHIKHDDGRLGDAGVQRSVSRSRLVDATDESSQELSKDAERALRAQRVKPRPVAPPQSSKSSWSLIAGAVIAIAAVIAWKVTPTASDSGLAELHASRVIAGYLSAAQRAFELGSYVEPQELSAAHFYAAALDVDPANVQAKQGLQAIAERLVAETKQLIASGELLRAQSSLDNVRRLAPNHSELPAITESLLKSREAERLALTTAYSAGASPGAVAAASTVVATQQPSVAPVAIAKSSTDAASKNTVQRKERTAPVTAETRYSSATARSSEAIRPEGTGEPAPFGARQLASTAAAKEEASYELLKRADQGRSAEPAQIESSQPNVANAALTVAVAPDKAESDRSVRVANSTLSAASKTAVTAAAPTSVDKPTLVKYVPPVYPQAGRETGTEGWLDVNFMVTGDGSVLYPRIEKGKLGMPFQRAAIAAVNQWKFTPAQGGSTAYRPMTVRVQFQLAN